MQTNQATSVLYRRIFTYVKPFWPVLLLGIVANIFYSGIDAGFTYLIKSFMDKSFIEKDLSFVRMIPLYILCGIVMRGVMSAVGGYCMTWVARSVVKVFRQQVFGHILYLPANYYDNATSGQLLSKILYDVEQISQVSADVLTTFVQSSCLVVGLLAVMFFISWQLSLLFLLTIPFVAAIVLYTNKRTRKISHSVQQQMGQVTSIASESIEGYQVVRMFGGQQYEKTKFDKATELSRRFDMKVAKVKVLNVLGVQSVVAIGIAAITFAAIKLTSVIVLTAGGFLSIIVAMLQLIKPLKQLSTVNSTIQRGLAGAESVFSLLDSPTEVDDGVVDMGRAQGTLQFEQLDFAYTNTQPVLTGINLTVKAGQTVALVGRSGGGKTTLASLVCRFYLPTAGCILLDGIDIATIPLTTLRRQIAVVSQQVTLFNDTLLNNIAYGLANVNRQAVIAAAEAAYAMSFINELPAGLDTLVGENGVLLSGGQRQRIAIARAMLKNAPILILDEATSALDTESERHIQAALLRVMAGRTTLVIAHRLSTIEQADNIVVLNQGRVIEMGSHQELLDNKGHYSHLHGRQFAVSEPAEGIA